MAKKFFGGKGGCAFMLPNTGLNPCCTIAPFVFGKGTPPVAAHLTLLFAGLTYYFSYINDTYYQGFAGNFVSSLNLGQYLGPAANVHFWLTTILQAKLILLAYPNMLSRFAAKFHGMSLATVQVTSALASVCIHGVRVNAFQGFFPLCVAAGFCGGAVLNSSGKHKMVTFLVQKLFLIVALWLAISTGSEKFSNFHHVLSVCCYFAGLTCFLSLGGKASSDDDAAPKRGRSKSRRKSKSA